nr:glycosyltransferase family 39 protein [Bacteroidota bacterium]
MENYILFFKKRSTGNILALLIILFFVCLSLIRLYPFENSLQKIVDGVDDWKLYACFALDIKHNGILMPSLYDNYYAPAGFLYNYFLALCFYLFGENTVPVFIIQNLLLGLSVAFIYMAFRNKMKALTSLLFLFTLFVFALFDVSKYYSFRLLSENLAIFTTSVFFFCFYKGLEKNKLSLQLLAAVFMGLTISTRPHTFPFGIILIVIVLFYFLKQEKVKILNVSLFVLLLGISASLLVIRNYLICGGWA